jgi:predicted RNase H-like HicB family nuclease
MNAYPMVISWSKEDEEYVAIAPNLRGCSATGATPEEAAREVQTAMHLWLEAARDNGFPIPVPTSRPRLARSEVVGAAR